MNNQPFAIDLSEAAGDAKPDVGLLSAFKRSTHSLEAVDEGDILARVVADAFSYGIKYSGQLDLPTGSPYRNALTLPSPGRGLPCTYFRFE